MSRPFKYIRVPILVPFIEDNSYHSPASYPLTLYIVNLTTSTQDTIVAPSKMVRKKFPKPKGETKTSFMFPSLHHDVLNAVSDQIASTWFHENDSDRDSNNNYETHVMGKFKCNDNACSTRGWSSKKVAILIRGFPRNGYNAVVFNQRCKSCNQLGILILDEESYVGRVAYRLKKWAGVPTERQYYAQNKGLPHMEDLCEGCKRGVCQQMNNKEYY